MRETPTFVGYQTATGSEKQFTFMIPARYGLAWPWMVWWWRRDDNRPNSTIYNGQLVVIWHNPGVMTCLHEEVSKTLDPKAKLDKRQKNLTKALLVFKNYLPKAK